MSILNNCLKVFVANRTEKLSLIGFKFEPDLTEHSLIDIHESLKKADKLFEVFTENEIFVKISIKLNSCHLYNKNKCFDPSCKNLHVCKKWLTNEKCPVSLCTNPKCSLNHSFVSSASSALLLHQFGMSNIDKDILLKFYRVNRFNFKILFFYQF
jgi:hypothetical protein